MDLKGKRLLLVGGAGLIGSHTIGYFTSTAKVRGFRARPVIGGVLIVFLKDQDREQKWDSMADSGQ